MPAMHTDVFNKMVEVLDRKRDAMVHLIPFDMTHDECIRLVAPSEHIDILKLASKVADIKSSEDWMQLEIPAKVDGESYCSVHVQMRTHAQKEPPLRPRTPFWQLPTEEAAYRAGEKIIAYAQRRLELGRRFGTAHYVLYTLNEACDTGAQLRYMMPAVLNLCKPGLDLRMDRWAAKFSAYKACRHTPAVSPQLKSAIQDAGALLTSCMLIGDDVPARVPGEVDIAMWSMPMFEVCGRNWARR